MTLIYNRYNDIRNLYLEGNPLALKGKNLIDNYLQQDDQLKLEKLLRFHEPDGISNEETFRRDEIDYFLDYFSILSLALIVGYLSKKELEEGGGVEEVKYYLDNPAIKRYYTEHYPLQLLQTLNETISKGFGFEFSVRSNATSQQFETFNQLNQTIDNDDVNQFLWFLDGGENDNSDVNDLIKVLSDPTKVVARLESKSNDALKQSIVGFFDYLEFLSKFNEFLKKVKGVINKAAYWNYHAYWFIKIRTQLKQIFDFYNEGLQVALAKNQLLADEERARILKEVELSHDNYDGVLKNVLYTTRYEEALRNYIPLMLRSVKITIQNTSIPNFETQELIFWAQEFNVSIDQLKEAVKRINNASEIKQK